uniref:hypothetical protein n=1 Tax=Eubacterium cellulosolvens TaxID=29322 RepID=UPI000486707D|nr:hypothetical protein [[Eubacterium] cellulosolvens]
MSSKVKTVLFAICLLMMGGAIGFIGLKIYSSQKENAKYRAEAEAETESVDAYSTTSVEVPVATPTPTVAPTPGPTVIPAAFSFRGDTLDEDGSDPAQGYPALFQKLVQDSGKTDVKVEDYTWENSGSLSQMMLAGVDPNVVGEYITNHQNIAASAGVEAEAVETVTRDDLADVMKDRTDKDSIPVLCMGFYGGWNNSPAELAEQYQQILNTYNRQDRYIILGVYPFNEDVDRAAYDEAMSSRFGEHYLSMASAGMDQPAFDDAGHQQIAQALFNKCNELGYFESITVTPTPSPAPEVQQPAADAAADPAANAAPGMSDGSELITLTDVSGNLIQISQNASGQYVDVSGNIYTQDGSGWKDSKGNIWKENS